MENFKIIGTNHLIPKEVIEKIIKSENPDILGVELCNTRFQIFTNEDKYKSDKKDDSLIGKISDAVKKKADEQNVDYGSDMKAVMFYAINNQIPLVLLDKDILEIRELMEKIPTNEQLGFLRELSEFESNGIIDKQVNELEVLTNLRKRYPIAFEFLITSRELFITNQILKTIIKYPDKRILIFIGKGHKESIERMLK
jgi:pheromone shutdown protein TraB